jgi:hypothetical protein
MQKYSSNVIEKCLGFEDDYILKQFVNKVCMKNSVLGIINYNFIDLMKNNYGNFVVQRAIKLVKGENKEKLMSCIMNNIERLGDKKIIEKWKSIVQKT